MKLRGIKKLSRFAASEEGFGLIELLIAMTVMAIAIMAIVAGMSSGMVALNRASRASTAATLADKQMETYRAIRYDEIMLNQTLVATAAAPYASDVALAGDPQNGNLDIMDTDTVPVSSACSATPVTCRPVQPSVPGPDGRSYRIDSYVVWTCAVGTLSTTSPNTPACTGSGAARPSKRVTIVVYDPTTPAKELFREASTFDLATG